jgi:hypothetical protein
MKVNTQKISPFMMRFSSLIFILLIMFIPSAQGVSLSCPNCYVDDCECITDCPSGYGALWIFITETCNSLPDFDIPFSGNVIQWGSPEEETYKAKVYCDTGEQSSCVSIQVNTQISTTTTITVITTTPPLPTYPPRPRTTLPRRTTTTTAAKTTTTTTASTTTTSTFIQPTTTRLTTTLRKTTTTSSISPLCSRDGYCDIEEGENYKNCPQDCPSGFQDGYCDGVEDGLCDPDCFGRDEDLDCPSADECGDGYCDIESGENEENCPEDCSELVSCNDGICDYLEGENYLSCPEDCPSGSRDGYCDKVDDGICDEDCKPEEDPDCNSNFISMILGWLPYILLILILLFLLLFFVLRRRGKSEQEEREKQILDWVKVKLRQGEDPDILRRGLEEEGFDPSLVDKAEEELW